MGVVMNTIVKKYHVIAAIFVFIVLPMFYFELGDFPRRSILKESISLITILAFILLLGQFFLSRSSHDFVKPFRFTQVLSVHKFIGYSVFIFFLAHPFLIVLPRFFEAGVSPLDAFIQIITTFGSIGIILGLISWVLILLLAVTSFYRDKLMMSYKAWKVFHGLLSTLLIIITSWHSIELGRHIDSVISIYIVLLAMTGSSLLIKKYLSSSQPALGIK